MDYLQEQSANPYSFQRNLRLRTLNGSLQDTLLVSDVPSPTIPWHALDRRTSLRSRRQTLPVLIPEITERHGSTGLLQLMAVSSKITPIDCLNRGNLSRCQL